MICSPPTQNCSDDHIQKEMDGKCSTYGGAGEVYTGFWWGNQRERDQQEDRGVDERIILRRIFRKWGGEVLWRLDGVGSG